MPEGQYFIDGYAFATKEEYNIALREQKNINSLRTKMDMNNKESILLIYRKLASKRLLISPIGIQFMKELRDHLIHDFKMEETELPMIQVASKSMTSLDRSKQFTNEQLLKEVKKKERTITTFKIVVFGLVAIIVGMFVISATNDNTGFINYENKILNKYSEWEEQLDKREAKIKEQEKKLGIENDENASSDDAEE